MSKNEMGQKEFKLAGSISMMANLAVGFWAMFLVSLGVMFYKLNVMFISLAGAMFLLYLVTAFLGYKASKRLDEIQFKGTAIDYADSAKKQAKWVMMPIPYTISMGYLRKAMWDYNTQQRTKNLSLESDVIKEKIKITKELKKDGYISQYKFDKIMPSLEEDYKKTLVLEKEKDKKDTIAKKETPKSNKELEDEKWA